MGRMDKRTVVPAAAVADDAPAAPATADGCVNGWAGGWVEKEEVFCLGFCRDARDTLGTP